MTGTAPRPLRAVVVGAGTGGTLSLDALEQSPRFEVVGIADLSPSALRRQAARFPSARLSEDYRTLLAETRPDVVCVSTWPPGHEEVVAAALRLGPAGLLVEKPLGDSAESGARTERMITDAGIPHVVPHGLLARAAPLALVADVRAGLIGPVSVVEVESSRWDIVNAGIHWIQFFLVLVAPDTVVRVLTAADVSTRTHRDGMQVETEAITVATTAEGKRLLLHTGDEIPVLSADTDCVFRIIGADGIVEYAAWSDSYRVIRAHGDVERRAPEPFAVSGHRFHLEHLADLIEQHRVDDLIPSSSLHALEVVDAAYRSNRERRAVTLPLGAGQARPAADWDAGTPYRGGGGRDGRTV